MGFAVWEARYFYPHDQSTQKFGAVWNLPPIFPRCWDSYQQRFLLFRVFWRTYPWRLRRHWADWLTEWCSSASWSNRNRHCSVKSLPLFFFSAPLDNGVEYFKKRCSLFSEFLHHRICRLVPMSIWVVGHAAVPFALASRMKERPVSSFESFHTLSYQCCVAATWFLIVLLSVPMSLYIDIKYGPIFKMLCKKKKQIMYSRTFWSHQWCVFEVIPAKICHWNTTGFRVI